MSLSDILRRYNASQYTVTDTMLAVLQLVSADNVDLVMSSLPQEVGVALRQFIGYYHPGIRIFNGPRPSVEAVGLVKEYLAKTSLFTPTEN